MVMPARATIADVARLAEVSAKTVSRVFDGSARVAEPTRQRVMDAATRLRFRPNTLARDLRRGGITSSVAFIMGDIENPFYFAVAAGVEQELSAQGFTMLLATTEDSPETERVAIEALLAQRVRALLVIPVSDDQSYLEGERQLGTPIVGVDRPLMNLAADAVTLANRTGMADAVRSLTALGHRRIAFVANPTSNFTVRERLAGYRQALGEVGVLDTAPWEHTHDDRSYDLYDIVVRLLASQSPPTAIVTGNNRATTAVLRALRENRDSTTAIIGFDDFELAEMLGISVVSYDARALGREAARLALGRIADPAGVARTIELPTRVVHRGSGERAPA